MKNYLLIFIGGGAGSLLRFFIARWVAQMVAFFPLGTLVVNILSSFLLGVAMGVVQYKHPENTTIAPFLMTGLCGGFSTFSAFSNDTLLLFKTGNYTLAFLNILLNVVLCIIFIIIGIKLIR